MSCDIDPEYEMRVRRVAMSVPDDTMSIDARPVPDERIESTRVDHRAKSRSSIGPWL